MHAVPSTATYTQPHVYIHTKPTTEPAIFTTITVWPERDQQMELATLKHKPEWGRLCTGQPQLQNPLHALVASSFCVLVCTHLAATYTNTQLSWCSASTQHIMCDAMAKCEHRLNQFLSLHLIDVSDFTCHEFMVETFQAISSKHHLVLSSAAACNHHNIIVKQP